MIHSDIKNETTKLSHTVQESTPVAALPRNKARSLRTGAIIVLTMLLMVVFGTGLFAGWTFAGRAGTAIVSPASNSNGTSPFTENTSETMREAVVAKVRPTVVQINVATSAGQGLGSGVVIDRRGYIVTNYHVVDGAQRLEVMLYDGTKLPAQLVGTDPADDLAVVKITPPHANLAVATLGDSSKVRVGQEVLAIGNPLGITQTVTKGIISAVGRTVSEGKNGATIPDAIQTDAPINPGNSGGALVDLQGNVIGIPTLSAIDPQFKTPANGVGFAIPSNRVQFIVPQIIETGKVTHTGRAALGVTVTGVDAQLSAQDNLAIDYGVLIVSVVADGAAAKAGLQSGDVIVQIDDKAVDSVPSLGDALVNKNPGERISVQVYRGNQHLTINITLAELPAT
ncbi:MAG: trypsin-like peptidase domain-containing protein [Ktedonobacteraceae bacterium]